MNVMYQRRAAALLEVLGVFLVGQFLRDQIEAWIINHKILPPTKPARAPLAIYELARAASLDPRCRRFSPC